MYNVKMFATGVFNEANIPCGPELLYKGVTAGKAQMYEFEDINIVQEQWEAKIIVDEITPSIARTIDYVIIENDEDPDDVCVYIVKNYKFEGDDTCTFNLWLDPLNTVGGFEDGSGNIIISGSVNRLSVPLETVPAIYPEAENNTLFTLDEPFRPSSRLEENIATPTPPTPPGPAPIEPLDFRYSLVRVISNVHLGIFSVPDPDNPGYNKKIWVRNDGTGWRTTSEGGLAIEYNNANVPGQELGGSIEITEAQYISNMEIQMTGALTLLANNVPAAHPKLKDDLNLFMAGKIITELRNYMTTHTSSVGHPTSNLSITAYYQQSDGTYEYWHYTDGRDQEVVLAHSSRQMNPFNLESGLWYRVHLIIGGYGGFLLDFNAANGEMIKE